MNRPQPTRLTKRSISQIQISRAVKLLTGEGDAVSALTLAGAAEEILGQMLQSRGLATAFERRAAWDSSMWDYISQRGQTAGKKLVAPTEKEIRKRLNHLRNEFKHNQRGTNSQVSGYYEIEAEDMLLRAVDNYLALYNTLPRCPRVREWWDNMTL